MKRAGLAAVGAAFICFAAPAEAQSPAPAPASDEQAYQKAMECKVRVEALELTARDSRERKRLAAALTYWIDKQRAAGAGLGKTSDGMLGDEMMFGFAEGSNPDSLRRAIVCAQQAEQSQADQ